MRRLLQALCLAAGMTVVIAAIVSAPCVARAEVPRSYLWGFDSGLMAGVAVMHLVQPVSSWAGETPWRDKMWISLAGAVLYTGTSIGLAFKQKWALWVSVIGPIVGLTAVLVGWGLSDLLGISIQPDTHQILGGVLQLGAMAVSIYLLRLRW